MTTKQICQMERKLEEMGMEIEYRIYFVELALEEKKNLKRYAILNV